MVIMQQFSAEGKTIICSKQEYRKLLDVRLEALRDATAQWTGAAPIPARERHGWSAYIILRGRDRDGSLRASVRVDSPNEAWYYRRHVRLIPR